MDNFAEMTQIKQTNIGPWDKGEELENINSKMLIERSEQYDLVAINTFHIPKCRQKTNLATWYNYEGAISKQLGYILINKRYRNWIKKITNNVISSTNSPMQHRAIIIDIEVTLKASYFNKINDAYCPYDIRKARSLPNLAKHDIGKSIFLTQLEVTNGQKCIRKY